MSIVLEIGRLLVHKISRDVVSVYDILPNGKVVLEMDCDGSLQNDDNIDGDGTPEEILAIYEPWRPGMVIRDLTGKGCFCRENNSWHSFFGIPSQKIEQNVLANQKPWITPMFSIKGIERIITTESEETK